eukprot:TRINITY_DN6857_c0_g1_i1.p1 TRINITY_DN6857_c0_g1~~TRINITY_DN6857_c0_g1_i1.p1  ORF type:complete len:701 (+),score=254.06 TRINITY_DN6857_c0_g1_i1:153-2255(+)
MAQKHAPLKLQQEHDVSAARQPKRRRKSLASLATTVLLGAQDDDDDQQQQDAAAAVAAESKRTKRSLLAQNDQQQDAAAADAAEPSQRSMSSALPVPAAKRRPRRQAGSDEAAAADDIDDARQQQRPPPASVELGADADDGGADPLDGFQLLGPRLEPLGAAKAAAAKVVPGWMHDGHSIDQLASCSVDELEQTAMLDARLIANMRAAGFDQLFPVQTELLPVLLSRRQHGGDVCVCAPTGSGKTLAYVLPIAQVLQSRVVTRLRALVLVPTRDLVLQVTQVFRQIACAGGLDLKVEPIYGGQQQQEHGGFRAEQQRLVCARTGDSLVDIVVATPGRLVDHLHSTAAFSLHHLRFLVIDEADRLLQQSYHDWLPLVLDSTQNSSACGSLLSSSHAAQSQPPPGVPVAPFVLRTATTRQPLAVRRPVTTEPLQKLLFSATLTHNPHKLAALRLNNPRFWASQASSSSVNGEGSGGFSMPSTLTQWMVETRPADKPLIVYHMLTALNYTSSLCFTSSVDATHRLYVLLRAMGVDDIAEFSSNLPQPARAAILQQFNNGSVRMLICSDVMSRGMDLQDVRNVINYDVPVYVRAYVHRCGRTARAGRSGTALTLVSAPEIRHFKQMLQKVQGANIKKFRIDHKTALEPFMLKYEHALSVLKQTLDNDHRRSTAQPTGQHSVPPTLAAAANAEKRSAANAAASRR